MRVSVEEYLKRCYRYAFDQRQFSQKQFDYIYKHLDFDKVKKNIFSIQFVNNEIKNWFYKTYINNYLEYICNSSPEGYQWLKDNLGNGVFKLDICYYDKQELKTIVNKVINVRLMRK